MPSSKPQKGINDLETVFPEIAKEADGWDLSTVTPRSSRKKGNENAKNVSSHGMH